MVSAEGLAGRLLVASPLLKDGVFDRSVVFVLQHDDDGAVGVVLNRPSEVDVSDVAPDWWTHACPPSVVFTGGPVSPMQLLGLARLRLTFGEEGAAIGTVDLTEDADSERVETVRVFAGYAGWSAGQLEGEIAAGGWYIATAAAGDAFSAEPEELWRTVLRRQHGQLALLATFPEDPSLN